MGKHRVFLIFTFSCLSNHFLISPCLRGDRRLLLLYFVKNPLDVTNEPAAALKDHFAVFNTYMSSTVLSSSIIHPVTLTFTLKLSLTCSSHLMNISCSHIYINVFK